jgi:hypothetical protein
VVSAPRPEGALDGPRRRQNALATGDQRCVDGTFIQDLAAYSEPSEARLRYLYDIRAAKMVCQPHTAFYLLISVLTMTTLRSIVAGDGAGQARGRRNAPGHVRIQDGLRNPYWLG